MINSWKKFYEINSLPFRKYKGFVVLRFWESDILKNETFVKNKIK